MALTFPKSRILPDVDLTERAIHVVIDVVADFQDAIATADTYSRQQQLLDRIRFCLDLLTDVQNRALRKGSR